MCALLVKNGTVVNADKSEKADVLIDNGIIQSVGQNIEAPAGCKIIDATDKLVMPGGIEPHCHLDMPFMGTYSLDDYNSGSRCCLAGGTTFFLDFIIPARKQSFLEAFDIWAKKSEGACCDFGQHMAVTWFSDSVAAEMEVLANEKGINSFKHFLAYKGALMLDDEGLIQSFAKLKKLGCLTQVHAENGDLVVRGQQRMIDAGITGPEGHPQSRPSWVEGEAALRSIRIAQDIDVPLYIVHNTCMEAVNAISEARMRGQRVFGEAVIPHLVCDSSQCFDKSWETASNFVLSPPLREKWHQCFLWNGLSSGVLQTVATDHCTFNRKQKEVGRNDFRKIPNGMNGLEERMSVMWEHGVRKGRFSENDFVRLTSTAAAQIFNVYPQKGLVAKGADADVVIWNTKDKRVISADTHHSKIEYNCYEGMECIGFPEITICQGKIKWEVKVVDGVADWKNGTLSDDKQGRFVKRKPFAPAVYGGMKERAELCKPVKVER